MRRGEIPTIGELTSFVAAAHHGSFTRAAAELHLTQGAISRQIRLLEGRLGVMLFERIRQRVVLTDTGRLYLPHVEKALDELVVATRQLVTLSDHSILNLAVLPTFATRWLIPRMTDFQARYPDVTLRLTTRQRAVDFAVEPFDAAIFYGSPTWPGTIAHHLMDMPVVPVCSPALIAGRAIRTPEDIAALPLIHQMTRPTRWAEWMTEAGMSVSGPLRGNAYEQFSMIAEAAIAGVGVALLPLFFIEDDLAAGRLVVVSDRLMKTQTSYYLIVPETRASLRAVQVFTDWLIELSRAGTPPTPGAAAS